MMRSKLRKSLGVCAMALVSMTAACGGSAQSSGSSHPVRIALFVLATANAYSAGHIQGATAEAKKLGATLKVFDGGFDATKQYNQLQDATTSGQYDAFLVVANDG